MPPILNGQKVAWPAGSSRGLKIGLASRVLFNLTKSFPSCHLLKGPLREMHGPALSITLPVPVVSELAGGPQASGQVKHFRFACHASCPMMQSTCLILHLIASKARQSLIHCQSLSCTSAKARAFPVQQAGLVFDLPRKQRSQTACCYLGNLLPL